MCKLREKEVVEVPGRCRIIHVSKLERGIVTYKMEKKVDTNKRGKNIKYARVTFKYSSRTAQKPSQLQKPIS